MKVIYEQWSKIKGEKTMEREERIECAKCRRAFTDNDIYITIKGGILVGEDKGIVGGEKDSVTRFCPHCLIEELQSYKELDENNLKSRIEQLQKYLDKSTGKTGETLPSEKAPSNVVDIPEFLQK